MLVTDGFFRRETEHHGVCTCTQPGSLASLGTLRATSCLYRCLLKNYTFSGDTSYDEMLHQEISSYEDVWIVPVKAGLDYMKNPLSNEQLLAAGLTSPPSPSSSPPLHCHHGDHHDHPKARQAGLSHAATSRSRRGSTGRPRPNVETPDLASSLPISL